MERLVVLGAVLAFVCLCHTSAQHSVGTVVVDDGRIGIGHIAGGNIGPGSFSINDSPGGRPQTSVSMNKDEGGNSGGSNSGNTLLYPVKTQTALTNLGQGGNGGEENSGGGQILISSVLLSKNKHNKGNKNKNVKKQPDALDAAAIEAIFGSNSGNNGFPSAENGLSSTGSQESIQIASITGGNFEEGTLNIKSNNKNLRVNVLQKGSGNSENDGNPKAGNEAQYSSEHGANNKGAGNVGGGSTHGQTNSGYNKGSYEEPWIWNR